MPTLHTQLPMLDAVLDSWSAALGKDATAYRNHCYRMANFTLAQVADTDEDREKVGLAAAFHDLGIWSDSTVDYLPPSSRRARDHLLADGRGDWVPEIEAMIDEHHRLSRAKTPQWPRVEAFRRADLVDLSFGAIRFGVPAAFVGEVRKTFPNAGFHKRLGQLAGTWFKAHPLSPPPFLKW